MALLIPSIGPVGEIFPRDVANGFSHEELRQIIGCAAISILEIYDGQKMAIDRDGPSKKSPANLRATTFFAQDRPTGFAIVGNAVLAWNQEIAASKTEVHQ